jgi:hypothetical protein
VLIPGTRRSHDASIPPKASARQGDAAEPLTARPVGAWPAATRCQPGTNAESQARHARLVPGWADSRISAPPPARQHEPAVNRAERSTPRTGRSGCSHTRRRDHRTPAPNRSDFLPEGWKILYGDRRQGRGSVSEYSSIRIDIRADEVLISACQRVAAAADRLSGDQLVPLSLGQPCHHQVVGMLDELQHFLIGHRAVERHGVPVPLAEVVTGPDPGVA